MAGIPFTRQYFVHVYETNVLKQLTVPAMMRYFEEMALLQSEAAGIGFDYYKKHNVAWVLNQFDIRIRRYPVFGEKIILKTLPVSTYGFLGYRKYWIYSEKQEELVSADTSWIFINPQTKRPVRVNDDMKRGYGQLGDPEQKLPLPEVQAPSRVDQQLEFHVRFSDIDVNKHVNNTHYVEWALEALPAEIRQECSLKNIRIHFRKETTYPAMILSQVQVEPKPGGFGCCHNVSTSDGTLRCLLFTAWESNFRS